MSSLPTPPSTTDSHNLIAWFRQAMPYINAHRGKTFVITLGGSAVASKNLSNVIHDIVLLSSLGVRIVIVHGVRQQLDEKLQSDGINSQFVAALRVTDKTVLEAAIQACSLVRSKLETLLSMGLPNSPMHGAKVRVTSANAIIAKPAGVIDGVDLQHTGIVRKIDTDAINSLLHTGNIVLLSPMGYSPAGEAFSLGYQHVAAEIAIALRADKLISLLAADGLHNEQGELLRELDSKQAQALFDKSNHDSEIARCTEAAVKAVQIAVPRAHIMSYQRDGALLQELFSVDGSGTLIQKNNFESIRQANADDSSAIIDIIKPLEQQGVLVKRERDRLEKELDHFTVIEREGLIIALAALYPYSADGLGEIACITTHPDYRNSSRGALLLKTLENKAKQSGLKAVFVLTTQTTHWFIEQGFVLAGNDDLPQQKQSLYNFQRNSKVLIKKL
jgi:amino-acid N-acetyltransferase